MTNSNKTVLIAEGSGEEIFLFGVVVGLVCGFAVAGFLALVW